jgi:hypothetical protein
LARGVGWWGRKVCYDSEGKDARDQTGIDCWLFSNLGKLRIVANLALCSTRLSLNGSIEWVAGRGIGQRHPVDSRYYAPMHYAYLRSTYQYTVTSLKHSL